MAREKTGVKNRRDKSGLKNVGRKEGSSGGGGGGGGQDVSKQTRKADLSLSKLLSQISHPQMPQESLQPWSETFFALFIFIYLIDALWGQHIYMYKE